MSDNAQIIVDIEVSAEQAPEVAHLVRAWLIDEGIIEREQSDSVLGSAAGYRPGRSHIAALKTNENSFLHLRTNGVAFVVGRTVFDAGGNGIELRCDACGSVFEPDSSWSDAVSAWFNGDNFATFPCPSCGYRTLLTEWRGPWPWGFGNLGLKFWNWPPLCESFIHAISENLRHRTVLVRQHI